MFAATSALLCCEMFFDERLRGPQPIDSSAHQDLIAAEDLYSPAFPIDDLWKKFTLPTPPYSPENYLPQTKRNFVIPPRRNGLQVVPEPEDLSSDLPLVLSDAEMERLTCSTIDDEYIWPAGENDFDRVESQRFQGNRVVHSAACVNEPSAEMATEHQMMRDLSPFVTAIPSQDSALGLPQVERWHSQFSVENPALRLNQPPSEEFVTHRLDCTVSKKPRKSRRSSRQDSPPMEGDDSEDNETSRATHNVLERQRREDLKCRFQFLRDSIPELEDNDRASKVLILKKAREYVHQLFLEEERLLADKELERQRRLILLDRLTCLRQGYGVM
ncbi:N-myc proto-oncogene protein isoform X1 [Pocillopora verrucosa]|uniref:N-myc proto-oncogene protein isoform X1 n=2 Tax=Pocillopora verrucosa TaxID=203993 RepID=UPI0027979E31|nr:N-myc proto-oncogene protein-like isoform X1 [Pocillopora verrucosa]